MQQKTEGRVVGLLSKHLAAEDRAVEQWFLVAIDDDEKAKETISKTTKGGNEDRQYPSQQARQLGAEGWRRSRCSSWRASNRDRVIARACTHKSGRN
jgi:hypothetical protein